MEFILKTVTQIVIFLVLTLISSLSYSVTITNLAEIDVAVKSQSSIQRKIAIQSALKKVIFKHVANESVFENEQIKNAIKSPSHLVNQFSYFEEKESLFLKIQFSEHKIIELLRAAQVPIWGKSRPLTISWIAYDNGDSTVLESDTSENEFIKKFKQQSELLAIPIVLPIMDFDEATSVTALDIKGSFVNQLHNLNQRYDVEYYILLNVVKLNNGYNFSLKLFPQAQEGILRSVYQYSGKVSNETKLMEGIFKPLAGYFSKEYAVAGNANSSTAELEFINVDGLKKAVDIERYLSSLSTVKSAYIKGIKNSVLVINLNLYGDEENLVRLLKLDPKITAVADVANESAIKQRYNWQ